MLTAYKSNSGKTLLSSAITSALVRRGLKVRPYKCGPDYLDRIWLSKAASFNGSTDIQAYNLDPVLTGEAFTKHIFNAKLTQMDGAVVEGVMGLFDGLDPVSFYGSSFHVAQVIDVPVVLIIDAKSMAASTAAVVKGVQELARKGGVDVTGVILNRVSSPRQEEILRKALSAHTDAHIYGAVPVLDELKTPSRHLGLEILSDTAFNEYFERITIDAYIDLDRLMGLTVSVPQTRSDMPRLTKKAYLAMDEAFFCYYPTTLDLLQSHGYAIHPFSPIRNESFEGADLVLLGGGWPELHKDKLTQSNSTIEAIHAHRQRGVPIFAECGGFIYLCKALDNVPMAGIFNIEIEMTDRLQRLGYVETDNGMRGHMFHYSRMANSTEQAGTAVKLSTGEKSPDGYRSGSVYGGYTHYMPTADSKFFIDFINGRRS